MRVHPSTLRSLRKRLLDWFDRSKRDLPWRQDPTPYKVLVSEFMLQQTQVETVLPYFHRFIEVFPNFQALAEAEEEEVLRLWSGLGYYRRARNLRLAAQRIVEEHQGRFPNTLEEALALPGVGRYTAGAVMSIAYGERVPLVDGNVERVLSRLFVLREDFSTTKGTKAVWDLAEKLVPEVRPGDFNQALMELGALVCAPTGPRCLLCPLSKLCRAYREGVAEELPVKSRKQKQVKVEEVVLLLKCGGRWLLTNRNEEGLYEGMWQFPWGWKKKGERSLKSTLQRLADSLNLSVTSVKRFHSLSHGITYRRIESTFYSIEFQRENAPEGPDMRWVRKNDLIREAMPGYQKKMLNLLPD